LAFLDLLDDSMRDWNLSSPFPNVPLSITYGVIDCSNLAFLDLVHHLLLLVFAVIMCRDCFMRIMHSLFNMESVRVCVLDVFNEVSTRLHR
jgi:hypothetical protein